MKLRVPEREERIEQKQYFKKKKKNKFDNIPKLMKGINSQIQKSPTTPKHITKKKSTPTH